MNNQLIADFKNSTDRFKIFALLCSKSEISDRISWFESENVPVLNIGKEIAQFLDDLEDYRYLTIDVFDFLKKLLDNRTCKIGESGNSVIAIYNLGILFEDQLELNAANVLKEFSKISSVIIIWENEFSYPDKLFWKDHQSNVSLDFSDAQLKILKHAL
jgi:hypothetical protein